MYFFSTLFWTLKSKGKNIDKRKVSMDQNKLVLLFISIYNPKNITIHLGVSTCLYTFLKPDVEKRFEDEERI